MKRFVLIAVVALTLAACASAPREPQIPAHGVIGVTDDHLDPEFWIRRGAGSRLVLDTAAIDAQNAKLQQLDKSVHDVEAIPRTLSATDVSAWVERMSVRPADTLYDEKGQAVASSTLDELVANVNVAAIPATQSTRYGMVVRRSDLRSFRHASECSGKPAAPTSIGSRRTRCSPARPSRSCMRVATANGGSSSVSATRRGSRATTWHRAHGTKVFAYAKKEPYLIVTGTAAHTVFTPERPEVSEVQLEMGQRIAVLSDWPAEKPVNGQHPYAAHVVELPMRAADGSLHFTPALIPRTAELATGRSAADSREPDSTELQVPRRALRLGSLVQRARLQRLRVGGLSQLRRAVAA